MATVSQEINIKVYEIKVLVFERWEKTHTNTERSDSNLILGSVPGPRGCKPAMPPTCCPTNKHSNS